MNVGGIVSESFKLVLGNPDVMLFLSTFTLASAIILIVRRD